MTPYDIDEDGRALHLESTRHAGALRALGLTVVLYTILLSGCQGQPSSPTGSVQLKGSETLRPLLTMCAEDFMARHPHIDVMVQGGGSGPGIAALLQGTVDIGMASRGLSDKERQYATEQGLEVRTFNVALDGITVVVHADNPVEVLMLEQLRGIFTGHLQPSVVGPEDLAWARVAVVMGTPGEEFIRSQGLSGRTYPFVIQACKALQRGEVEAVIYNKAILGHMLKEYGWKDLSVLPQILVVEEYAILLPSNSSLREALNRAVLHTVHSAGWKATLQRYIAADE